MYDGTWLLLCARIAVGWVCRISFRSPPFLAASGSMVRTPAVPPPISFFCCCFFPSAAYIYKTAVNRAVTPAAVCRLCSRCSSPLTVFVFAPRIISYSGVVVSRPSAAGVRLRYSLCSCLLRALWIIQNNNSCFSEDPLFSYRKQVHMYSETPERSCPPPYLTDTSLCVGHHPHDLMIQCNTCTTW